MKKENTGQQKQIYSIRKNKAYGASSVLIGLMGSAFLLSGLAPTVQAEENDAKPETKPVDGSAVNGTNALTVETEHLIIASQPKGSEPKSESTPTDNSKSDVENAPTNETKPLNSESSQPKEAAAAPVKPTEGANPVESGTTEVKPSAETTPSKRAVSIVYKVRYVDRKSHKVVHEVTKTKTVETTEAKAKASITEIGGELANDSQLENYYVPDGNPTTFTKEIVEGEDNVFVYEVEGFGEAETPKERTVTLKYTLEYVDGKSGLVLVSEEKEEKVSTTEKVAKKEVMVQPSLAANEKLKDWILSDGAPTSQKLTLSEGTVGKVTVKLQKSEPGKVRNKRKVETPIQNGQPYLTLEILSGNSIEYATYPENITLPGNGQKTYEIKYQIGASNLPNNDINELVMTDGAERLGFTLNRETGLLTKTLTPTRDMEGTYEVGIYVKSRPEIKVSGTIQITAKKHYGFMILVPGSKYSFFRNSEDISADNGDFDTDRSAPKTVYGLRWDTNVSDYYVSNKLPKTEVTINKLQMPTTPFGYLITGKGKTVKDVNQDTKRYYTMLPIFAPMNRSTDFANNDKQGLFITKFKVLEASDGVEAKLIDLRHDKAPDKGGYSNNLDFQTVTLYDKNSLYRVSSSKVDTPYYLQFTKLPKLPGNYFTTVEITDSLGLTKKIRLNFSTFENSVTQYSNSLQSNIYVLTTADTRFEAQEDYVNKKSGLVSIPMSNKEQILGKVVLNKDNAYIKSDEFPAGVELRAVEGKVDENGNPTEAYVVKKEGVKVQPGEYSFSVKAHDGHFQDGGSRRFDFEIVDAINPIADQHWREGSVPPSISISMENHSHITGIRVEPSGDYAYFEGNAANSSISVYGLKRTETPQKARVYVTYTDGAGKSHETFTDFNYQIEPNNVDGLNITVTNNRQEIFEGESFQDMVIETSPSEGVTIKIDKDKLPKGTRLVGNVLKGKGLYEGVYDIPVLAVKGDVIKSATVHLVVKPKEFVVPNETSEVEVLSNNIMSVTTGENGKTVKTPVTRFGLQNVPDDATVTYVWERSDDIDGLKISSDRTRIIGTPNTTGTAVFTATISRKGSNGQIRSTTSTYTVVVTGFRPSLTISSGNQSENAYSKPAKRLIAPLGTPIPPITIKHDPHSTLTVNSGALPEGLSYTYDEATHTGTITGIPSSMRYPGYIYSIPVSVSMPNEYADTNLGINIHAEIDIEVTPLTSALSINNAEQTFTAAEKMRMITVSDFDERATIELEGAPTGVSYNLDNHRITGAPLNGVGTYTFNVKAIMPSTLGGQVTRKQVTLTVVPVEPILSANPRSVEVMASESIPEITITKDSASTLSEPSVMIGGTSTYTSLSSLGLSYDAASKKITGIPTIVGNHTIHLATTLSERYTGTSGGKTLTLDIPLTVRAKDFDFVTNQEQTTTVLSPITPINLTVPEGIEVSVGELPSGLTYDAERKMIQGTPNKVGTYTITVTGRPRGFSGNDKIATLTIHVNNLPATIGITNKEQTVQVGTAINDVTVTSSEHANIYGIDALLSAVSGNNSGIVEANIANYFLGAYGLTYNATNHTISGTPTKTGRIVFTFIARTSENLGAAEARETVVLNVVESLSKIPVITEVREGTSVVKGTGVAGATVTVTLPTGDEKTALVSGDGSWSVDTTSPLGKGQSISARQKEVNKTMSNDISATVVANDGLELSKEPIVEAIIEGGTTITGKGENGSTINVTLPNGTVKTTTVTDGRWTVTLESPVVKGDNILVSQTQPNKATSPSVSATVVPTITKGDKGDDGAAGKDGISPEVSIEEDSEGNHIITITQPGKTPITTKVKNGRDGRTPKVAITPIYEDSTQPRTRRARSVDSQPTRKQIGIHITVYYDNNNSGSYDNGDEVISEEDIYDGLDGQNGKDILSGTTDPMSETGKEGDKYVNTTTGDIFVKKNGQWEREGNLKGPKGDKGETGAAGVAGQNGRDGQNGQNGRDGENGQNGQNGRDGKDILSGTSDPTSEIGKEGDKYVNTTTGDIFVKKNGQWEREGNLKGPKGDKGDTPTITTQPGADGISTDIILTLPGKEPITVNVKNGTNGRDGLNGKSLVAKKEGNETKIYVEDPANPGQPLDVTKPIATILDGLKGDKGEAGTNGVDGKSPVINMTDNGDGTHSIIIRNPDGSESTTKVKNGKDGKTATITTTENPDGSHTITVINPDGASKEIVVRDGKTPKVEVTDNGNGTHTVKVTDGDGNVTNTIIKDGKDGKAATATTTENPDGSHTVTITNPDGTTNNFIVKNGRDGVDGRTPTATVRNNNDGSHTIVITNPDGVTTETTIRDGQSPKVTITDEQNGTHKITVLNSDGTTTETIIKDGKSPVATITDNHDGTYTIRVENGNGTVSEMTVRDGKSPTAKVVNNGDGTHTVTIVNSDGTTTTTIVRDGQSPKLEVIDNHNGSHTIKVIGSDGKETSTTIFDGKSPTAKIVDNGDGTHTVIIVDSNGQQYTSIIRDGKDGKDGKSPTATVRNNNDGTHTITIINPDGSKTETIIKDGKDGKSPEVTVEDNGNGTHTITIINVNGIVYKTIIRDGKCGCNDKPGGHTPENPTNPGGPTFAMPAPPVHDKPEFKGGVPGMPVVYEKTEYPGIPTNPSSDETTPGTPTPGTLMNPNPGVTTPGTSINPNPGVPTPGTSTNPTPVEPTSGESTNPNPGVPTSEGSTNPNLGVPTSVGSTNPNSDAPTSEGLTQSNPEVSSAVNEYSGSELPKTGTKAEYLPMLLASGALLTLYIGRRKEEEE